MPTKHQKGSPLFLYSKMMMSILVFLDVAAPNSFINSRLELAPCKIPHVAPTISADVYSVSLVHPTETPRNAPTALVQSVVIIAGSKPVCSCNKPEFNEGGSGGAGGSVAELLLSPLMGFPPLKIPAVVSPRFDESCLCMSAAFSMGFSHVSSLVF